LQAQPQLPGPQPEGVSMCQKATHLAREPQPLVVWCLVRREVEAQLLRCRPGGRRHAAPTAPHTARHIRETQDESKHKAHHTKHTPTGLGWSCVCACLHSTARSDDKCTPRLQHCLPDLDCAGATCAQASTLCVVRELQRAAKLVRETRDRHRCSCHAYVDDRCLPIVWRHPVPQQCCAQLCALRHVKRCAPEPDPALLLLLPGCAVCYVCCSRAAGSGIWVSCLGSEQPRVVPRSSSAWCSRSPQGDVSGVQTDVGVETLKD
jgi:hypothetical protein